MTHRQCLIPTAVLVAILLLVVSSAIAQAPKVVMETLSVAAKDPGIQLHIRNKRPDGVTSFAPERIVLFVHGGTYPSESGFDLPLEGTSWMDYVAQRGFDVYAMDVRGYGRSTRPPEMDRPASEAPPLVSTDVAV